MIKWLAISRAGHDRDTIYAVLREESDFFFLADGRKRGMENPKKKKKKHVQVIKHFFPEEEVRGLCRKEGLRDEDIRRIIRAYTRQ